jgi:chromosome segregation ATPase
MTMRSAALIASALSLSLGVACNTARDQQEKAVEAQAEANEEIAEATEQAGEKINEAQAEAHKKTAEAQAEFTKIRENYRHDVTTKLADLDKKIAELEAKAKTEPPAKRATLDTRLAEIRTRREAFVAEYRSLETASALTWDNAKKSLDKSWNDLENLVERQ